MVQTETVSVLTFDDGDSRVEELAAALEDAWKDLVADVSARERVAAILGIDVNEIQVGKAPVQFAVRKAGFSGSEIALMAGTWLVGAMVLDPAKDLIKDFVKAKCRQLWSEVLEPALRKRLPGRGALGTPKPEDESDKPNS